MIRPLSLLIAAMVLLTGCGKKLSGRYEAEVPMPRMQIPGVDPKVQTQMNDVAKQVEDMNRMSLEFDGSKVRMGSSKAIGEYSYRIDGNRLEIISEARGQKMIIPMTIEEDGAITYLQFHFKKIQ